MNLISYLPLCTWMQVQKFRHSSCVHVPPDFSHVPPVDNHWPPPCSGKLLYPFRYVTYENDTESLCPIHIALWVPHIFSLQLLPDLLKPSTLSWLIRWHLCRKCHLLKYVYFHEMCIYNLLVGCASVLLSCFLYVS